MQSITMTSKDSAYYARAYSPLQLMTNGSYPLVIYTIHLDVQSPPRNIDLSQNTNQGIFVYL